MNKYIALLLSVALLGLVALPLPAQSSAPAAATAVAASASAQAASADAPTSTAAVVVTSDPAISADVQNGITGFLGSTSWGVKLLGLLVLLNLIGPPISDAIHNTVRWTATLEDDEFLAKVENNTVYRWFVYLVRVFGVKAHPSQD